MAKPVKCQRCGRENDPSLQACLDCGALLARQAAPAPATCGRCGATVLAGFRFCGRCGAELAATPSPDATSPSVGAAPPGLRLSTIRTEGAASTTFPLRAPACLCGRLEGEIRLADDPTVSPRHASFTIAGERVTVEDLGSVNGTFLRIRAPHRLAPGEEIRLGRQLLRVEPLVRPDADGSEARSWGAADPGHRMRLAQLLEGGGLGEIHPLHQGENVIGREAGEVVFPGDRYVSARHARIDLSGEAMTLTDLGSSNGTFCRLAGPTSIVPGDQLLIGAELLKLES
ncbi:MAG TPA: FHA domain-containing protein [Anaeromyxobacter sp.]|nr:FHA domain-containing protein [Anaeromyxobacter sp.]